MILQFIVGFCLIIGSSGIGFSLTSDLGPVKAVTLVAKHPLVGNLITEEYLLDNGLSVFLTPNVNAPNTSIIHMVRAGSLHEKPGITGIAHLFEHMMFRPLGPKEDDFATKLSKFGGDYNASTRFESTVYTTTVPDEYVHEALKIEAERFRKLKVTKELLDIERKAVWSEYSTKMDANPIFDLWYTIYNAAFSGHPFGWMIIGFREDLEKITAEDCMNFFSRLYRPNNTGLFVSGKIDVNKVLTTITEQYRSWPRGEDVKMPAPYKHDNKYVFQEGRLAAESNNFMVGFRTPVLEPGNKGQLALQRIVNHIFFSSDYSLAKRRFVFDKKIASKASEFNFSYDNGMIRFFVVALPGITAEKILNEVILLNADFNKLSEDEFKAYFAEATIELTEAMQRNENMNMKLAQEWGKSEGIKTLNSFVIGTSGVSKEDVARFVSQFFKKENMVIVTNKRR